MPVAFAMPSDQGSGLHDDERVTPVEEPGQEGHRDPGRAVGSSGPDLALLIESELLPEEEDLSVLRGPAAESAKDQAEQIMEEGEGRGGHRN
jgi:hypothetical protein